MNKGFIVINEANKRDLKMYKATRSLIQARQKFSKYVIQLVEVKNLGGGQANQCFQNACSKVDRAKGITIVSGWIVDTYNVLDDCTEITQHWWNADSQGNHFDTTPIIGNGFEYVIDVSIAVYGRVNYEQITSCVSSNLLLKNNIFYAVNVKGKKIVIRDIADVSNDSLFAHQFLKEAA
jgi:hypothetical protein